MLEKNAENVFHRLKNATADAEYINTPPNVNASVEVLSGMTEKLQNTTLNNERSLNVSIKNL